MSLQRLTTAEGRTLQALYAKVRERLQARLEMLIAQGRRDTFTAQQTRQILMQLDAALVEMNGTIFERLAAAAESLSERGVSDLVTETQEMAKHFRGSIQPLNIDAALIASDSRNLLLNQYRASIEAYSSGLRAQIGQGLAEMIVEPTPLFTVVERIGSFFEGEEWKVLRIARTELHNIYSSSKIAGLRAVGQDALPGIKKTLYHPRDSRTDEDSLFLIKNAAKMVKDVDEPFDYWWCGGSKKKPGRGSFTGPQGGGRWYHRVFMSPPDRPNDRSILVPFHPDWA